MNPSNEKSVSYCLLIFFITGISTIYYGRYLDNFFALDDFKYLENVITSHLSILLGYNAQLRIVSNFAWYPTYLISGVNPFGYNLVNIIVNAVNTFLLYLIIFRLTDRRQLALTTSILFISSASAADAVLWKMSISTLLSTLFFLITLFFYIDYRNTGTKGKYLLSLCAYLFAMFSKEDAASLPFVVILLELFFFDGLSNKLSVMKRITPFIAIIIGYLCTSYLIFHYLGLQSESAKFFKIRPLYSLLGGFTSLFIKPDGHLTFENWLLYMVLLIILIGFTIGDKKMYLFGSIWIVLSFLPSSLTSIVNFNPANCANSISRILYLPSIGSAFVIAISLDAMRRRWSSWISKSILSALLVVLIGFGYSRVHERGEYFLQQGGYCFRFIAVLKFLVPYLPSHSYVAVSNSPTSVFFTQSILRTFYGDPTLQFTENPHGIKLQTMDSVYYVKCDKNRIPETVEKIR